MNGQASGGYIGLERVEREQLEVNRGEVEVVLKGSSPFSEPLFVVVEP